MSRHSGGSSGATAAPCVRATQASGRGSTATPAPASTNGTIASRWSVSTAIRGVTPISANATSSRSRVDVPDRLAHERLGGERGQRAGAAAAWNRAGARRRAPGARAGG